MEWTAWRNYRIKKGGFAALLPEDLVTLINVFGKTSVSLFGKDA